MLRLMTFGGVAIVRDGRPVGTAGRRRVALLALLAAAGERGIPRDTLAALLWPDSERAAESLNQERYALCRALGADDLLLGTSTLSLNPACVTVDVWEFHQALRARQLEQAVALYQGVYAQGIGISGNRELDEQLDEHRRRYAREYAEALEALAESAASRDDPRAAARWWRRFVEAEPLSTRAALKLIEALAQAEERVEALRFARTHVTLVRQEGAEPDAKILQWIEQLQRPAAPQPPIKPPPSPPQPPPDWEQRRLARLLRALGQRYRVSGLLHESSSLAAYAALATEGSGGEVEVHVVGPEIAAAATPERFVEVLGRVASLSGPNVLPTLDYGVDDGLFYFVTARRPADSLRERLRRERELPIRDAVAIARDVCAALATAHERGVRHGDLRPKHIGLTPSGALVRLFGVAEACAPSRDAGDRSTVIAFGSPSYQPPEWLEDNAPPSARGDVYAFGAIVYEMLVGEPPFGRSSRSARYTSKVVSPAPPSTREFRASVPAALDEVVLTCLARVPADRYASGGEVARALGRP